MQTNTIKYPYNLIFDFFGYDEGNKIDGENFEENLRRVAPKVRMRQKQIDVILTKYEQDLSLRQVADMFGLSAEGVRRMTNKLKARITAKEVAVQFYNTDFFKYGDIDNFTFKIESKEPEQYTEENTSVFCLYMRNRTLEILKENGVKTVEDLKEFINNDFNGLQLSEPRKQEMKDALTRVGVKDNDMQIKDILLWVMDKYEITKKELRAKLNEIK